MSKTERLEYMKKRFPQLENEHVDAVLPVTKRDVEDEVCLMDGFREYTRDKISQDEG